MWLTSNQSDAFVDLDFFCGQDPYVKVVLGGKDQQTTVKKGKSPVWEQTFTFNYTQETSLKFTLWDKDFIGSDYLAVHDLPLLPILTNPNRHFDGEVGVSLLNNGREIISLTRTCSLRRQTCFTSYDQN